MNYSVRTCFLIAATVAVLITGGDAIVRESEDARRLLYSPSVPAPLMDLAQAINYCNQLSGHLISRVTQADIPVLREIYEAQESRLQKPLARRQQALLRIRQPRVPLEWWGSSRS